LVGLERYAFSATQSIGNTPCEGGAAVRYAEHDPAVELDHPQRHRRARIGMGITIS